MLNPLVNSPYLKCPKCSEQYFGVLSIGKYSYSRRCAKCGYPTANDPSESFPLPELKKTVIYLDQFVVSNMVKSLHPDLKKEVPEFYLKAFEKLDRLSKLQLIVCPDSEFHEDESLFSMFPKEHKRVYEQLSHGVSYWDMWTIFRFEVLEHLTKWLDGRDTGETEFTSRRFTHGEIDTWQERLIISVNTERTHLKSQIREDKSKTFDLFKLALTRWSTEKGKDFNYWYAEELSQWKWLLVDSYKKQINDMINYMFAPAAGNPSALFPTTFYLTFKEIMDQLKRRTKSQSEYEEKLNQFLDSKSVEKVPYIRIISMIFATVAHRLSSGNMKVEKIKQSFFTDANLAATLLPFCNAIFLEKQMAGFLRDAPLKNVLKEMPRVFSLSSQDEFLDYLDGLERSASQDHKNAVQEVYGSDWGRAYTTILYDEKERQ